MKKIIVLLKVWLSNWINYLGLCLLFLFTFHFYIIFLDGINEIINLTFKNLMGYLFVFPLYVLVPFTFGYLFFQFLIDSILLFVFKFSIRKTIKIENYIFNLILTVVLFFTVLIQYSENKIDYYEVIKFLLIGLLILILCSSVFIYTQKKRIKKIEKILETKARSR